METDPTLLNAAKMMDKDALVKIFDLYSSALYRYALRLCSDPVMADQIVGDVFAKLLDQLSSGNGPGTNLRSYLYEITYHQIIDEVRYSQRRVPLETADSLQQAAHSASRRFEDQVMFQQVLHAIRHDLTDDQRHVVILRFLEDFSLRETAAIIGKEVNHVKVIQNRAVAKLRQSLDHKGIRKTVASRSISNLSEALGI